MSRPVRDNASLRSSAPDKCASASVQSPGLGAFHTHAKEVPRPLATAPVMTYKPSCRLYQLQLSLAQSVRMELDLVPWWNALIH